jgi:hypothetical protein
MKKQTAAKKLSSLLQKKKFNPANFPKPPKFNLNKNYGMQARIVAMHNVQRASGRRGN